MRGLFCLAVYRGQAIKPEWKERPLLSPPETPIKPVPDNGGGRAPMESLLFTDQCVYLSRKHLLWGSLSLVVLGGVGGRRKYSGKALAGPWTVQDSEVLVRLKCSRKLEEDWDKLQLLKVFPDVVLSCKHLSFWVKHEKEPSPPAPLPWPWGFNIEWHIGTFPTRIHKLND